MTKFSYMDDATLAATLTKYRSASIDLAMGGGLTVIAGEGRRKEFTRANPGNLAADLRELEYEASQRNLDIANPAGGGSIEVEFGRGHFGGC